MISTFHLFFWAAMGCLSAFLAKKRGKNPYLWFGLGLFLGILSLFLLFFMPKKKTAKQSRTQAASNEDEVTIDVTPSLKEKFWYYLDESNAQEGPMSYDGLKEAFHQGKVTETTYVWNEEMEDWQHFEKAVAKQPTN